MTFLSNDAQRLFWSVQQLAGCPSTLENGQSFLVRHGLERLYQVDQNADLMRVAAELVALPDEALEQLIAAAIPAHFMRWHPSVKDAVKKLCNLDSGLSEFKALLDPTSVATLEGASHVLGPVDGDEDADEIDRVNALIEALSGLADEVERAGIGDGMTRFLLDQIDRMKLALREFRIRGGQGVADEADAAVGAIARAWRAFPPDEQNEEAKTAFQNVMTAGSRVGDFAVKASAAVGATTMLGGQFEQMFSLMS